MKTETHHSVKKSVIVVALAAVFAFFTLWLIESWIKYPLFLFEVFAIIVLYLIISGYDPACALKIKVNQAIVGNLNTGLIIDVILVASALSLLTFNALRIEGGLMQVTLALLCASFLSGYAILNIFGLARFFSKNPIFNC